MSGGKALYETLRKYDVEYLFGMGSPEGLFAEINLDEVKPITVHHEEMGAHMADGYARVSYKPGICCGNQGAGVSNLVTGLAEAYKSSIPVVALAQAVPLRSVGKNGVQELDQAPTFKTVTKWVGEVHDASRIPEFVKRAFRVATTGRPGPAMLHFHEDQLAEQGDYVISAEKEYARVPAERVAPDKGKIRAAAELLVRADSPCILAGGGVIQSQAWAELIELAELLMIPVATTIMGKGSIPETHPLSVGGTALYIGGKYGRGSVANKIVSESDTVLLIGTRTQEMSTSHWTVPNPESTIIHIDIDPEEIGRNYQTAVGIVADAKLAIGELVSTIMRMKTKRTESPRAKEIKRLLKEWRDLNAPYENSDSVPVKPQRLMKELKSFIDNNTVVVSDVSTSSAWAASHLDSVTTGRTLIQPRGIGVLGAGFPLAVGAKLGAPRKKVICIAGDHAFMCGGVAELETAARYKIPVVTVILNNSALGWDKLYDEYFYGTKGRLNSAINDLTDVDYSRVAKAFGCWGRKIEKAGELSDALKEAFEVGKPAIIDVPIGRTPQTLKGQCMTVGYFERFIT